MRDNGETPPEDLTPDGVRADIPVTDRRGSAYRAWTTSGPVIFVDLSLEVGVLASTVVASMAEEHGLVAFDLMLGMLRPVSDEVIAEYAADGRAR